MSWIEVSATICGLIYIILLMRENIWCWLAGNISVGLMAISCYEAHLFADMCLQIFYFGLGLYGFLIWIRKPPSSSEPLTISSCTRLQFTRLFLMFVCISAVAYIVLTQVRGAALASIDATLFGASIVATYMQAKKFIQNWLVWMPINVMYAFVYTWRDLPLYSALSVVFCLLSAFGWFQWSKQMRLNAKITRL